MIDKRVSTLADMVADCPDLRDGAIVLIGGFGDAGVLIRSAAAGTKSDQSDAMVLQADDRVPTVRAILAGEASSSNYDFALMRLWL